MTDECNHIVPIGSWTCQICHMLFTSEELDYKYVKTGTDYYTYIPNYERKIIWDSLTDWANKH